MQKSDAFKKFAVKDFKLPSPPAIGIRILEAVKSEETSSKELAKIISSDPALVAKILKVANSAFYATTQKVDNIRKAITILGQDTLKNIALSFVIAKDMQGNTDESFDFTFFWKRSITAAVGAELLTDIVSNKRGDLFVTALLQDIGIVIMYLSQKDNYLKVFDEKQASGVTVEAAERKIFGFDHQELGAHVLESWGLSENIYVPVRFHHDLASVPEEHRFYSYMLSLSDMTSSVYHGTHSASKIALIKDLLDEEYGVESNAVDEMIDSVAEKSVEILSFFDIPPENMKPYSQILLEANQELGKLNFSYEQLLMEYKQAKEKAEKLAGELKTANTRLRELAFRDGLTGLYNHRHFQELMDKEMSRAMRYKRPFALVLFDLDHFKKVNDKYGHPAGDQVLKVVSHEASQLVRESDTLARYGGEEFAVILPETDLRGAGIFAERLRKAIAATKVKAGDVTIDVSISVGVTSFDPTNGTNHKTDIISAADKALYHSKNNGRNRISLLKMSANDDTEATAS